MRFLLGIGLALLIASPAHAGTSIDAGPPSISGSRQATFSFSGTGDRFECSWYGDWTPCESPWTVDAPEGRHAFVVRSVADDSFATYEWTVDVTPPQLWVAEAREGRPGIYTVVLAATESLTRLRCTWDSGPAFDCGGDVRGSDLALSDPFDLPATSWGFHTLTFEGTDLAGLVSTRRSELYSMGPAGPAAVAVPAPPAVPPPPPPATSAREFAASVAASLNADAPAPVRYEAPKKGTLTVVVRTATGRRVVVWRGSRALRTREIGDVPLVLTTAGARLLETGRPVRVRVEVTYRVGRRVWSKAARTVVIEP